MRKLLAGLLLVLGICCCASACQAQETNLEITKVMRKLSNDDNVTVVTLKGNKVAQYNLSYFTSATMEHPDTRQIDRIEKAIRQDDQFIVSREERTSGPHIAYGFYCLTPTEKSKNRYVFYTNNALLGKSGYKVTLIYLEGKASLAELKRHFKK